VSGPRHRIEAQDGTAGRLAIRGIEPDATFVEGSWPPIRRGAYLSATPAFGRTEAVGGESALPPIASRFVRMHDRPKDPNSAPPNTGLVRHFGRAREERKLRPPRGHGTIDSESAEVTPGLTAPP
jgi:hypothetical protein